ncbi:hypothetical protein GCM10009760_32500 [Kitasatospora kazusensis]|uniref:Uncharacterized protein n=1 Tax=Kitasatospora kazusensis TaxID=407974 RepID=A0ABN2ZN32_9ACTN
MKSLGRLLKPETASFAPSPALPIAGSASPAVTTPATVLMPTSWTASLIMRAEERERDGDMPLSVSTRNEKSDRTAGVFRHRIATDSPRRAGAVDRPDRPPGLAGQGSIVSDPNRP